MKQRKACSFIALFSALLGILSGCRPETFVPQNLSQGVAIQQDEMEALRAELTERVTAVPAKAMNQPGLVGALGGAHLKLLKTGEHEVLLPLPQLVDGQVPLCFYISSTPRDAVIEYRLRQRGDSNYVVGVRLKGERNQEIQIDWSSVVLVARRAIVPNDTHPDRYLPSTACVQSEAEEITTIARDLWPESGQVTDFARNIQQFVREMKQARQPRSLDALGILDSGANGICTANANLALALLRSKGIASRSIAVIPPISQRLEMHRIVEYFDDDQWRPFDPSSLHVDLPTKPWQNVIMAKTTISDEDIAMKPRMGSMPGCPYAQELELMSTGVTLWGQNFFWTIAKPVAQFETDDATIALAVDAWNRYLEFGTLGQGQVKAASAQNATEFEEFLRSQ